MDAIEELEFFADHLDELALMPAGVDWFRSTVLKCAVSGALSKQLATDEPASELLARAAEAKASYVTTARRRSGRTGKGRGRWTDSSEDLPDGWVLTTMEEITTKVGSGSTPRGGRDAYVSTGPIFLRSQNVWDDALRIDDVAHISAATHERMAGTAVLPHDVLLNITGASIGRATIAPPDIGEANVSQHVMIIRPALAELAPFLHLYIISPEFQRKIDSVQVGISRDGLSKQSALGMPVPVPPLEEQRRIVNIAHELLALVEKLKVQLGV